MRARLLPLAGRRILVTRPRAQSRALCERLRRLGAEPVAVPTISIAAPRSGGPLDQALTRLRRYDWVVVTSANGAKACVARARALGIDLGAAQARGVRWAAIGPATAAALRRAGIQVALVPSRYLTAAVAQELRGVNGQRILLPRTEAAGPALRESLRARGASVDEVTAYHTVLAPVRSRAPIRRLISRQAVDTVVFTSASTVHGLVRLLEEEREALRAMTIACIGPITAAAVIEHGFRTAIIAEEHSVDGLVRALVSYHGASLKGDRHARDRAPR
ncbi:MAG: uroporphyrinogen-III synthase [Armatimonadota bacterium]